MTCDRCQSSPREGGSAHCRICAREDRFLAEPVVACPDLVGSGAFGRFMHKFAVHAHASRTRDARHVSLDQMEESLTGVVLKALPMYYVSVLDYDQPRRKTSGFCGSYTFKAAMPREVLYRTLEKVELWIRIDPDDPRIEA